MYANGDLLIIKYVLSNTLDRQGGSVGVQGNLEKGYLERAAGTTTTWSSRVVVHGNMKT